jgi:hypothetical protein
MASSNQVLKFNSTAEAAIVENTFVMVGVADNTVLTATAGAVIIGVAEDPAAIDTAIGISHQGKVKLKLGGSISAGQKIKATTGGTGVYADTTKDEFGAIALEDGVIGDVINVIIAKGATNI